MKNNSGLYGIWTHDFCDASAALYQLSQQANRELVIVLFLNKPVSWWINSFNQASFARENRLNGQRFLFLQFWEKAP